MKRSEVSSLSSRVASLVASAPPRLTIVDAPHAQTPFVIGVAGGTASGKTSVVTKVLENLRAGEEEGSVMWPPESVAMITMDRFYKDLSPEEQLDIKNVNFDHPSAFAFEEMYASLHTLKQGGTVQVPQYDFVSSARLPESDTVSGAQVIIFEGILALYMPEMRDLFDMKIFVDTDADTRLARRLRRDIAERGRDLESVLCQYESTVKPAFEQYVLPTKQYADIIVPHGAANTVAIDLISQHLRDLLHRRILGKRSVDLL
eukprot:CAMPEP_0118931180 /NCGR_PEP_ID=MMETSP1169-20130426/7607_1 /TAXON_ID=36882 /ORGANISM="Pyramimonas obovata, Strain CCMP722" /LENGTH=259 /DNA_ID=CAMNT_0006873647 /DNA_START=310 /DNA_END=1089 /DNA_ORIENTATION=+